MFRLALRAAASVAMRPSLQRCGGAAGTLPLCQQRPRFIGATAVVRCASAHDAKLSSLLDSELRYEKTSLQQHQPKSPGPVQPPPPAGFALVKRDGTLITLARKCDDDGSLLEVTFDLNGSTVSPQDEDADMDAEQDQEAPPPMGHGSSARGGSAGRHGGVEAGDADGAEDEGDEIYSRPELTFRVRKPSSKACLAVRCSFPPLHISRQMSSEDPDYPTLSIDTVAVEGGAAELGAYELDAEMLNDDLYKQLAEMLVHRGVTRDFEAALVEYCTSQEHQLYLRFLAEAKKFCDA